jgi:uncharacterized LabA/DUF88 family protein
MPEKKEFSFYLYNKSTLVIIDWYNIWNKYKDLDLQLLFNYLKTYKEVYQVRFYNGLIQGSDWSQKILDDAKLIGYEVMSKNSKEIKIEISKEKHLKNTLDLLDKLLSSVTEKNSEIWNKLYTLHEEVKKKISEGLSDSGILDVLESVENNLKSLNIQIDIFKLEIQKPIKKPKCDFDAEIARDIILEIEKYENLILFSGDGDFASTIKYLIEEKQKRVFVMYPQGNFGQPDYIDNDLIKKNDVVKDDKKRFKYKKNFTPRPVDHILQHIIKKEPADCSVGPDTNNIANPDLEVK